MSTLTINQNNQEFVQGKKIERTAKEKFKIWFYQNRFAIFSSFSMGAQLAFIAYAYIPHVNLFQEEKVYEEIAFVTAVKLADPVVQKETPSEGEIKETDKLEKKQEEMEDPRIATAQNPYLVGATIPVDLTPDIIPEYPIEARSKGIEGVVTLEVVIGDEGKVLKVRALNKPLGYGLEESAIKAFLRKKFQPAILEGKPITVKVLIPVQFRLR